MPMYITIESKYYIKDGNAYIEKKFVSVDNDVGDILAFYGLLMSDTSLQIVCLNQLLDLLNSGKLEDNEKERLEAFIEELHEKGFSGDECFEVYLS